MILVDRDAQALKALDDGQDLHSITADLSDRTAILPMAARLSPVVGGWPN